MLIGAALSFINHLLEGEAWARDRLQPFSGRTVRFVCGPMCVDLAIGSGGTLKASGATDAPTVTFTLPPDALWRSAGNRAALVAEARINGSADLAEAIGFVLRHLRWEIEDDLAPRVGDIAARRLVQGGRALSAWHRRQAQNLALNGAEYFTSEVPLLVRRDDAVAFASEVDRLSQETDRLARRLDALSLPPRPPLTP